MELETEWLGKDSILKDEIPQPLILARLPGHKQPGIYPSPFTLLQLTPGRRISCRRYSTKEKTTTDTGIWEPTPPPPRNETAKRPLDYLIVESNNWQALLSHSKLPIAKEWTLRTTRHGKKASDIKEGHPNRGNPESRRNHKQQPQQHQYPPRAKERQFIHKWSLGNQRF